MKILFLPGVTKSDLRVIDLLENSIPDISSPEVIEIIPTYYISEQMWIKETKLCCWYCSCPIKGRPWPMPLRCENIDIMGVTTLAILIRGLFHNPFCIVSYIEEMVDNHIENKYETINMLRMICKDFLKKELWSPIPNAINRSYLAKFGGTLSDDMYIHLNNQKYGSF